MIRLSRTNSTSIDLIDVFDFADCHCSWRSCRNRAKPYLYRAAGGMSSSIWTKRWRSRRTSAAKPIFRWFGIRRCAVDRNCRANGCACSRTRNQSWRSWRPLSICKRAPVLRRIRAAIRAAVRAHRQARAVATRAAAVRTAVTGRVRTRTVVRRV